MITAEIGISTFILESIEQAESLMRILSSATQVDVIYVGKDHRPITYEISCQRKIGVALQNMEKVYSYDEAMKIKEMENAEV